MNGLKKLYFHLIDYDELKQILVRFLYQTGIILSHRIDKYSIYLDPLFPVFMVPFLNTIF